MLELKEKVTILYTRNLYMEKLDHMMTVPLIYGIQFLTF